MRLFTRARARGHVHVLSVASTCLWQRIDRALCSSHVRISDKEAVVGDARVRDTHDRRDVRACMYKPSRYYSRVAMLAAICAAQHYTYTTVHHFLDEAVQA